MLFYFFLLTVFLFIIVGYTTRYNAKQYALETGRRINAMEQVYERFIENKINKNDLKIYKYKTDSVSLAKDAAIQLNPMLEGLMNFINKAYLTKVKIKYQSTYFPNLVVICEEIFEISKKNPEKRITLIEAERFRIAIYEAILADINQRIASIYNENEQQFT